MDKNSLFRSISLEVNSKKNVFKDTGGSHRLTSGETKESILREIISGFLPENVKISSGFIANAEKTSSQIDILLYDAHKPVLYRNKEKSVVIITPDSVKGIIEVKTTINKSEIEAIVSKLYDNIKFVRENGNREYLFTGLFSYETNFTSDKNSLDDVLNVLFKYAAVSGYISNINHVSLGNHLFIKFWDEDPKGGNRVYNSWHAYELTDIAPAYFIMNTVLEVTDNNTEINSRFWFPPQGKEENRITLLKLTSNN